MDSEALEKRIEDIEEELIFQKKLIKVLNFCVTDLLKQEE